MARARLEARDERLLLREHRLLARGRALLLRVEHRALLHVKLVVARKDGELAAVDLDDLRHDAVHELAIVRGHHERALVLLQKILEPEDRLDVEVVRRLVEEHRVGLHQEDARERHAHLPPAGEGADVAVHDLVREAEAREDLSSARLERVATELLEARLRLAEVLDELFHFVRVRRVGELVLELVELLSRLAHLARAVERRGDDALAAHLAHVLAEVADRRAAIDRDGAAVGLLLLHDHAENGGLAGAVRADEADLLPTIERA